MCRKAIKPIPTNLNQQKEYCNQKKKSDSLDYIKETVYQSVMVAIFGKMQSKENIPPASKLQAR